MQTRGIRSISLLLLIFQVSTMAALRSGTGDAPYPPYQPDTAIRIDFSTISDTCSTKPHQCPCTEPDLWIRGDSIRSAYGIEPDSALGALAVEMALPYSNPAAVGPVFDSLFDSLCVVAPVRGWTKSAHLQLGAFYVKTAEGGYALLVIFGEYIGGINRYYYYWAYQDNGMRWLYKAIGPLASGDSIVLSPDIFSGRNNPIFVLRDSTDVALLHRAIDSLSNLAATIGIRSSEFPKLGGILVGNRQPIYMSTPVLEAMHDSVMVSFAPGNVWSIPDTGGSFPALLLSMLRREKPVSIVGYDTIEATWFLKMVDQATVALPPRSSGSAALNRTGGPVRFFSQQRAVEVRLEWPQHVSVTVFDCLGKRQHVLFDGVLAAGQQRFPLSSSARGVSLIRVQVEGAESVFIDLPMH